MTDEWDLAVDAEIEDRLLRKPEDVFLLEIGFRASLNAETRPRDMRWWYGIWTRSYGMRIG